MFSNVLCIYNILRAFGSRFAFQTMLINKHTNHHSVFPPLRIKPCVRKWTGVRINTHNPDLSTNRSWKGNNHKAVPDLLKDISLRRDLHLKLVMWRRWNLRRTSDVFKMEVVQKQTWLKILSSSDQLLNLWSKQKFSCLWQKLISKTEQRTNSFGSFSSRETEVPISEE